MAVRRLHIVRGYKRRYMTRPHWLPARPGCPYLNPINALPDADDAFGLAD